MENLRVYLNSLSPADQQAYANKCGTTVNYLRKAISKRSRFDGALARRLDEHSNGHVKKCDLRPDIWPELCIPLPNVLDRVDVNFNNPRMSNC